MKRKILLSIISLLAVSTYLSSQSFNMKWVLMDTIPANLESGSCSSLTDCSSLDNVICFALTFTPTFIDEMTGMMVSDDSLLLSSYTTFFEMDCASNNMTSIFYNESCIMLDNSDYLSVCPALGQRFNSSGNSGNLFVYPDSSYVLHQVCFSVPNGETLDINIRTGAVQSNASLGNVMNAITENLDVIDLNIDADFDCCASGSLVSNSVETALEELYLSTNGDNWANSNYKWLVDCDPCGINDGSSWYGITCSGANIIEIDLSANNLVGTIPPSLGDISTLEKLLLNNDTLTGDIPLELGNLSHLLVLSLAGNKLSGSIPSQLNDLTSLAFLYLHDNRLTGAIPLDFSSLTSIEQILLYKNQLSGAIPDLSNLTNLKILELFNNSLTGPIPDNLPNSLRVLRLHNNELTGTIPGNIGSFPLLSSINLSNNNLSGCYDSNLQGLCMTKPFLPDPPIVYFDNNPLLPASGDFIQFCNNNYFGDCSNWDCDGTFIAINGVLPNDTLKMEEYIISAGTVTSPNINVTFQARDSIVLLPGFSVLSNAMFRVIVESCSN